MKQENWRHLQPLILVDNRMIYNNFYNHIETDDSTMGWISDISIIAYCRVSSTLAIIIRGLIHKPLGNKVALNCE